MTDIEIDRDWFRIWKKSYYPKTLRDIGSVLSMYSPYFLDDSESENNGSYTSALTFGLFENDYGDVCAILFSLFPRSILNPNQVIKHSNNLCSDFLNNSLIRAFEGFAPDLMIVPGEKDAKSTLVASIQKSNNGVPVRRFFYQEYGKTLDNLLKKALQRISEGRIYVAAHPANKDELRNIDARFLDIVMSYPALESRSTVWALCQMILYLESYGMFEDGGMPNITRPKHGFYWGE